MLGDGSFQFSLRVYTNDFSAAAANHARVRLGSDSLIDVQSALSYIRANVAVVTESRHPIALIPCGVNRAKDMLHFCFKSKGALKGIRIRNTLMTELFGDQVNVVQSVIGQKRSSRLFVKGDGLKAIL